MMAELLLLHQLRALPSFIPQLPCSLTPSHFTGFGVFFLADAVLTFVFIVRELRKGGLGPEFPPRTAVRVSIW